MTKPWRLIIYLLLSIAITTVSSQESGGRCEPWAGKPFICASILSNTTIYVPPNTTQADLATLAAPFDGLPQVSDGDCLPFATRFTCTFVFQPCTNTTPISGQRICRPLCESFLLNCSATLQKVAPFVPSRFIFTTCTNKSADGVDVYPVGNYTLNTTSGPIEYPCTDVPRTYNFNTSATCPNNLSNVPNKGCTFNCPRIFWTKNEFQAIQYLVYVLGIMSSLGDLLLIIAMAGSPRLRKFPSNLVMCWFIAHFICMISVWIAAAGGSTKIWCNPVNGDTHNQHTSKACGVQAFFYVSGNLAFAIWYNLIGINLFFFLYFPLSRQKPLAFQIVAHILGWGYPLYVGIWIVEGYRTEYLQDTVFCTVRGIWSNRLFYWPLCCMCWFGWLIFIPVVIKVIKSTGAKGFKLQWRLLMLILWNSFLYLWVTATFLQLQYQRIPLTRSAAKYLVCLVTNLSPHCKFEKRPNYGIQFLAYVSLAASGIVFAAIFLSDPNYYNWYRNSYIRMTSSASSSSSSSNSSSNEDVHSSESNPTGSTTGGTGTGGTGTASANSMY